VEWAEEPALLIGSHGTRDITDEVGQRSPVFQPLLLGRQLSRKFVNDERCSSLSRAAARVPATPENNW